MDILLDKGLVVSPPYLISIIFVLIASYFLDYSLKLPHSECKLKVRIWKLIFGFFGILGVINFFYMVWVFMKYYATCRATECSIFADMTVNTQSSLKTFDFILTNVIAITFFVREGIRYGSGDEDDIAINMWKYVAYTFVFSLPAAFAFFVTSLLLAEENTLHQYFKDFTRLSKSKQELREKKESFLKDFAEVNPLFFLLYFVYFVVSVAIWLPERELIFYDLVRGDISNHYLNLSMQFITRANFVLWILLPLFVTTFGISRGSVLNTFLFVAIMMASSFSISTVLCSILLITEWKHPDISSKKALKWARKEEKCSGLN